MMLQMIFLSPAFELGEPKDSKVRPSRLFRRMQVDDELFLISQYSYSNRRQSKDSSIQSPPFLSFWCLGLLVSFSDERRVGPGSTDLTARANGPQKSWGFSIGRTSVVVMRILEFWSWCVVLEWCSVP